MKPTKQEQADALAELRAILPPGSTVYTILRSVSRSGMSRWMTVFVKNPDPSYGPLLSITAEVSRLLGYPLGDAMGYRAVKVNGCGMDMGFHLVNSLSYALHGMADKTPDTFAADGSTGYRPGYTLTHRWL